jgi:glycerophosphoryl diester phosphodiesterase
MRTVISVAALAATLLGLVAEASADRLAPESVQLGPRPFFLADEMSDGPLKQQLQACASRTRSYRPSLLSIGHRGAPMQFPEHTRESYVAAARMGAGVLECDVAFTKDKELVCRHAQNDLHTTTNILVTPLAAKCTKPFVPAAFDAAGNLLTPATAECRTSDITLAEFKTLRGKMDASNARTPRASSCSRPWGRR